MSVMRASTDHGLTQGQGLCPCYFIPSSDQISEAESTTIAIVQIGKLRRAQAHTAVGNKARSGTQAAPPQTLPAHPPSSKALPLQVLGHGVKSAPRVLRALSLSRSQQWGQRSDSLPRHEGFQMRGGEAAVVSIRGKKNVALLAAQ